MESQTLRAPISTYTQLSPRVTFFLWHSFASSTCLTYRTGQKLFSDFITLYPQFRNTDGSILPTLQPALLEWVTWLGGVKQLQPKTIKAYISLMCDQPMFTQTCPSQHATLLQRVIRGIKSYMGEQDHNPKLPITCEILRCMLAASTHSSLLCQLNFEASVTTAFSGFLRCGEFTVQDNRGFDPSINITRGAMEFFPSIESPSSTILTIPSSKTDHFERAVHLGKAHVQCQPSRAFLNMTGGLQSPPSLSRMTAPLCPGGTLSPGSGLA